MIDSYRKPGLIILSALFYITALSSLAAAFPSYHRVDYFFNGHSSSSDNRNARVQIVLGDGAIHSYTCGGDQRGCITFVGMPKDECEKIFQDALDEYWVLGYLPNYSKHNKKIGERIRNYARTLSCYGNFMLWLNDKIQHDKVFRKRTAKVPGFDYKFNPRKKKSEFHDFVRDEVRTIRHERAKLALLAQKPRLRVTDNTFLKAIGTTPAHHDPETTQRYQQRAEALKRTVVSNGTCSNYASHVPPVSADDKYADAFSNTYGTPLDCQLHKELCHIRKEVFDLEHAYHRDTHVQIIAPVIHRFAARAKVEQSPSVAFGLSDFCHDLTWVMSKTFHTLYHYSSEGLHMLSHYSTAVGKRVVKGAQPVLTLEHWKEMAKGTLHMGLLFLDAVGQEDVRQDALLLAACSKNYEVLDRLEKNYCLQTKAQSEALHHLARTTYDKLKEKSWQGLVGDGIELGTTMVLDFLALDAAGGFVSATSRAAVAELSSVMKQGLFTERYATEVAGFGKLVIEEGSEAAAIADSAIQNDIAFFQEASEELASQKIKANFGELKWTENVAQKIRNIGDDILDVSEKAGGHTLERHVGKTNNELISRAAQGKVDAASSFIDKHTAINAVQENLRNNSRDVAHWLKSNMTTPKVFEFSHKHPVGLGVLGGKKNPIYDLTRSKVVLEKDATQALGFKILTAFPIME
jgi:hypothetical protein